MPGFLPLQFEPPKIQAFSLTRAKHTPIYPHLLHLLPPSSRLCHHHWPSSTSVTASTITCASSAFISPHHHHPRPHLHHKTLPVPPGPPTPHRGPFSKTTCYTPLVKILLALEDVICSSSPYDVISSPHYL